MDAAALAAAFAARDLSPVEVTRAALVRATESQTTLNAFAHFDAEGAMAAAIASEARFRSGAALGPFDGVAVSVKDNIYVEGLPTRFGSRALPTSRTYGPDSPAVARLREAGAVILGKTTTPEFAHKMMTDSPLTGVTRNPWNLAHTPGGSSGGAAAAVAAGIGPLAIASDGAGSIRIPAAWTGVYGLKPSLGRVPHHPRGPLLSFSHVGPITRTVADAARAMAVLSRPDARDWYALPPAPYDPETALATNLRGLRVALSPSLGLDVAIDPETADALVRAAGVFEALGAHVELADPPAMDVCAALTRTHLVTFMALTLRQLGDAAAEVDPSLGAIADLELGLEPDAYLQATMSRGEAAAEINAFFERFDLLLSPVTPFAAPPLENRDPSLVMEPTLTQWCNVTGLPAASIACGLSSNGLPIGLQIVGRRWDDLGVLRASHAYEAARGDVFAGCRPEAWR